MDRCAIACFDLALADVGLAKDDRLRQVLLDYFRLGDDNDVPLLAVRG